MKVCTIYIDPGYTDEKIEYYRTKGSRLVDVKPAEKINPGSVFHIPALYYGFKLTKENNISNINLAETPSGSEIYPNVYWSFNMAEWNETNIDEFVQQSIDKFFDHVDNGLDPVFEGFNKLGFMHTLGHYPLVYNGKHEMYLCESGNNGNLPVITSMKKESLKYIGIDPDDFFYEMIDEMEGECYLIDTEGFDFFLTDYEPIFIVDAVHAKTGHRPSPEDILRMFKPKLLTRGELLTYYMKMIDYYNI